MSDFQIPLLSSLVGFLADIMRVCLEYAYKLTDDLGFPSYGIAIIVLTIIIKTALLPLAVKQIKSMKAMQEIQPLMQQVQKKYKNDPKKLREEMGKLYKEHGANPMSGCLPLLIQMPFLVSIYYALQGFPYDPAHESFLWLESQPLHPAYPFRRIHLRHFLADHAERRTGKPEDHASRHASYDWLDVPEFPKRPRHLLDRGEPVPAGTADHYVP